MRQTSDRRLALLVLLVALTGRPALAACTRAEAREKQAIAWDRASLIEMQDLSRGRALHARIFAIHLAGTTTGPSVDWGKVCAAYDEITKTAR